MWLSSKEFATKYGIRLNSIFKKIQRCADKKFYTYIGNFFPITYYHGIGGNKGKVLKIWHKPFESKEEAGAFVQSYQKALSEGVSAAEFEALMSEDESLAKQGEIQSIFNKEAKPANATSQSEGVCLKPAKRGSQSEGVFVKPAKQSEVKVGENVAHQSLLSQAFAKSEGVFKKDIGKEGARSWAESAFNKALLSYTSKQEGSSFEGSDEKGFGENWGVQARTGGIYKENKAFARGQNFQSGKEKSTTLTTLTTLRKNGALKESETQKELGALQERSLCFMHNPKAYNQALEKLSIITEWARTKHKSKAKDFIAYINTKGEYSFLLSENKLFAWQRAYEKGGFEALFDSRGGKRQSIIESLKLDELVNKLIMASRGRVNISSMHRLLHAHLAMQNLCDMKAFLAKESEVISYGVLERYVKKYLKNNPLQKVIIAGGEDAAVSQFLPALGVSNYKAKSINEIVEIDATSIDAIIDTSALAAQLGIEVENIEAWQKRFVLISLVDTYSGVCSFHISDTENSLGIARAIAKYIMNYGKAKLIKSDNGSAFVSKYIQEVLLRLDIKSERTPAYSGWCKPYVERNFARLQNYLMEWLKGYIGHNVSQRQAIEFFFSRSQRRLKRGQKSNYKDLHTLAELNTIIDEYTQSFMNNAYLERLDKTPTQAYNERANEAVAMNEYELSSLLSPLEKRAVGKKGIAYGGVFFYSTKIYEYANVLVARNINNSNELFVYDEKGKFLDIAQLLDQIKGVSAEEAKRSLKHFKKVLKETKAKMADARTWVETRTPEVYKELAKQMPKTKKPAYKPINDKLLESAKLKAEANKKSVNEEILARQGEQKTKKKLSWEEAVLKREKE